MMRRGPAGPRTLCNACGLKWANKVCTVLKFFVVSVFVLFYSRKMSMKHINGTFDIVV